MPESTIISNVWAQLGDLGSCKDGKKRKDGANGKVVKFAANEEAKTGPGKNGETMPMVNVLGLGKKSPQVTSSSL